MISGTANKNSVNVLPLKPVSHSMFGMVTHWSLINADGIGTGDETTSECSMHVCLVTSEW